MPSLAAISVADSIVDTFITTASHYCLLFDLRYCNRNFVSIAALVIQVYSSGRPKLVVHYGGL